MKLFFLLLMGLASSPAWAGKTHFVHDFIEFLGTKAARIELHKLTRRPGVPRRSVDEWIEIVLMEPRETVLRQLNLALLGGKVSRELDLLLREGKFVASAPTRSGVRGAEDLRAAFLSEGPTPIRSRHQAAMVEGETYIYQLDGNPQLQEGEFLGMLRNENGGFSRMFREPRTGRTVEVSTNRLVGWRSPTQNALVAHTPEGAKYSADVLAEATERILKHTFLPFRARARGPGFEMAGTRVDLPKIEKAARQLQDFDFEMVETLGFNRPGPTRVYFAGSDAAPGSIGPHASPNPIYSFWYRHTIDAQIEMLPNGWVTRPLEDRSILFHERVHTYLYAQYSERSFINGKRALDLEHVNSGFRPEDTIQEAFADFLSAHHTGQPKIGSIRDIERGMYFHEWATEVNTLLDLGQSGYHNDSLLFSGLLWKIRSAVGKERMSGVIKPFVDRLNLYWDSAEFSSWMSPVRSQNEIAQHVINEYEYFSAVWFRMLKDLPEEFQDIAPMIRRVVVGEIKRLSLNLDRIEMLATDLRGDPSRLLPPTRSEMRSRMIRAYWQSAQYPILAGGAIGIGGPFFYMLTQDYVSDLSKDEKPSPKPTSASE